MKIGDIAAARMLRPMIESRDFWTFSFPSSRPGDAGKVLEGMETAAIAVFETVIVALVLKKNLAWDEVKKWHGDHNSVGTLHSRNPDPEQDVIVVASTDAEVTILALFWREFMEVSA